MTVLIGRLTLLFLALCALTPQPVRAATIEVTSTSDGFSTTSTVCTLRMAIQAANTNAAFGPCAAGSNTGFDIILLPNWPSSFLLTLGSAEEDGNAGGDLDVTSRIVIAGPGDATRAVIESRGPRDRVFDVRTNSSALYLLDVDLVGGDVSKFDEPDGGVIRRLGGELRLTRATVRGGVARHGGGIYSYGLGEMQLFQTTLHDNLAFGNGGGLFSVSGVESIVSSSTISNNIANGSAGGVYTTGNLNFKGATVAFNRSSGQSGGMVYAGTPSNGQTIAFSNTIFSDNSDSGGTSSADILCFNGPLRGGGYNIIRRTTCAVSQSTGSFVGEARLSPLFDFGAGIPTHALLPGSEAIDAGAPSGSPLPCPQSDARGVARTSGSCDIGAFELAYDFNVNTTTDSADASVGDGMCRTSANQCSLRAAVQEANERGGRHIIRLPAGTYGLNLGAEGDAGGDLDIYPAAAETRREIAIIGASPATTRIVGSGIDRLFEIHGDFPGNDIYPTSVALMGLSIGGGVVRSSSSQGGGVLVSNANLLMVDAVLHDNHNEGGEGGGLAIADEIPSTIRPSGLTQLERVAVIDNGRRATPESPAVREGGGIAVRAGRLRANNTTISNNYGGFGGGLHVEGGVYADARLRHVTIAGNTASQTGGGLNVSADNMSIGNSIIAGNRTDAAFSSARGPDCYATVAQPLVSDGRLIVSDSTSCALAGDTESNLVNVDARLSVLQRSGPILPTHGLQPGSPALDLVPNSSCFDHRLLRVWRDQNERERSLAGSLTCDAGASEGVGDFIFADSFE